MIRLNKENINDPAHFDERFTGEFGYTDMERFEKLAKYFKGGSYADIGVFDSPMPKLLSERFPEASIHALDFAPQVIKLMQPQAPKVKYMRVDDAMKLPFADESMDYVVAGEIIEHMESPKDFVAECLRVLIPGGWLAVSTPHEEYVKASKIGGPFHLWSFDAADMSELFPGAEREILKEGNHLTWLTWLQK